MPPQFPTGFMRKRLKSVTLTTIVPSLTSSDYSSELAEIARRILYKSPLPSQNDLPIYVLNSAAFPDTKDVNYDKLLPYVLARLPDDEHLIGGKGYEVIFFAGGEDQGNHEAKKGRPGFSWTVQAYNVLSRAMRKRLQKLYLVHERKWVRIVSSMFSTIVSPKFGRKVVHVSTLSGLALHIPIEDLLIPPSAYYRDHKLTPHIHSPYASGRRAFGASHPIPTSKDGTPRLPRILRETTSFILAPENITIEGLFRVNARAITLEVLREAYDRGQKFLVWREGRFVMTFPAFKEGFGNVDVDEHDIDVTDGYPVLAAAGLMKLWYSELRNPVFPQSSYQLLERAYTNDQLSIEGIMNLIGENADWSAVNKGNRLALRMHLLPTLSAISKHPENRMTAKSLAICFAPSLVLGSDPIEDARICRSISQVLEFAISNWDQGLEQQCGMSEAKFKSLLSLPKAPEDREDPLDNDGRPGSKRDHNQTQGILLVEHDSSSSSEDEIIEGLDNDNEDNASPPPLPPRATTDLSSLNSPDKEKVKRKITPLQQSALKPAATFSEGSSSTTPISMDSGLSVSVLSLEENKGEGGDGDVRTTQITISPPTMSPGVTSPPPFSPGNMRRKPLPGGGGGGGEGQ